jgi:hypothetical protein
MKQPPPLNGAVFLFFIRFDKFYIIIPNDLYFLHFSGITMSGMILGSHNQRRKEWETFSTLTPLKVKKF